MIFKRVFYSQLHFDITGLSAYKELNCYKLKWFIRNKYERTCLILPKEVNIANVVISNGSWKYVRRLLVNWGKCSLYTGYWLFNDNSRLIFNPNNIFLFQFIITTTIIPRVKSANTIRFRISKIELKLEFFINESVWMKKRKKSFAW